jgi:predicted small lipoprotein YifL
MLNRIKNLSTVFHLLIIAMFALSLNGCGYKKAPYYQDEAPSGDENVKFIIKEPSK